MKKLYTNAKLFMPFLCMLLSYCALAQPKIIENKVDEFTGRNVKRTEWGRFATGKLFGYVRAAKVDSFTVLSFRLMAGGRVFAVDAGAEFMLKLDDGSVLPLRASKWQVACSGCGAAGLAGANTPGMQLDFVLTDSGREKLLASNVNKIRLYATDGYIDSEIRKSLRGQIRLFLATLSK